MQNGQPTAPPPLPRSIRTVFLAAGQTFAVDEDVHTFCERLDAFLREESQAFLWMTADHRPIAFSRQLMELFAFAKTHDKAALQTVEEPEIVRQINERR